jgi:hypothetical protein
VVNLVDGTPQPVFFDGPVFGPVRVFELFIGLVDGSRRVWFFRVQGANESSPREISTTVAASVATLSSPRLFRVDGLPDDCGDISGGGGQVITNINEGDTINNTSIVDNRDNSVVVQIPVNIGGIQTTMNLKFRDLVIGSLLPLSFTVEIGGTYFGFEEDDDGKIKPTKTNPEKGLPDNKIEELLSKIKECVCKPEVDLDLLFIPVVNGVESCSITTVDVLVPKGSVSDFQYSQLINTADAAKELCQKKALLQLEEKQIFAATVRGGNYEIFTGDIEVDVVSLRVKVIGFDESIVPEITLFSGSNQHKFGSIGFVGSGIQGGGQYLYVYDIDTYLPLPKRGKKGRLRILFKESVSFVVYDTGERY